MSRAFSRIVASLREALSFVRKEPLGTPKCPECGVRALCPWPDKTPAATGKPKRKDDADRGRKVRKG